MSVCWMFIMILMGCRSSHVSQSNSVCNYNVKSACVPAGADVNVPCPRLPRTEVEYKIYQGQEMIYNFSCSQEGACMSSSTSHTGLHKDSENRSVSFTLTRVNTSSLGIYRCEGTVMFPPPYKTVLGEGMLLLIEGHQCKKECSNVTVCGEQNPGIHWIWVSGLVSIYSVIVSIIAIVIWVKLNRTESQSDYMNTKPRPSRDRKRKKQNPVLPRHF